ncbi:hypothetical protein [Sorangium sp. So ce385]|uniref:hypothetical protein n=1 Tax=Sorangium sp. So ce385 TaxID=3133308 RepID=UPI003F5C3F71
MRETSEVRRWRSLVASPSLVLGVDDQGSWLRFVTQTGSLIPPNSGNMLFLLPLLDMEYADFDSQMRRAAEDDEGLRASASGLVQKVLALALQERAPSYAERALSWLEHVLPNDDARRALDEFARSGRGAQRLRQAAFSMLRPRRG